MTCYASTPNHVSKLMLSYNSLAGSLQTVLPALTNLTQLQALDLSGNPLTGTLPGSVSSFPGLTFLGLSELYGGVSGTIPSELGALTNLA